MNKKLIFLLSFILMVSMTTGIFAQIITTDQVTLSTKSLSFLDVLWSGCQSDFAIIIVSFLLALTVYLTPCIILLIMGKFFALGFSAAYLMSVHPQGLPIICAVLLPRCLLKLPSYVILILLGFETAKEKRRQKKLRPLLPYYGICTAILLCSSLIEAVLLLLIGSP